MFAMCSLFRAGPRPGRGLKRLEPSARIAGRDKAMGIILPKFIALDSSHLGDLARDASSSDEDRRKAVRVFFETLSGCGGVLLLSWHHIEELLQHDGESVVAARIGFLQCLPMVAWIDSFGCPMVAWIDSFGCATVPGTIADITVHEVVAAYQVPDADGLAVRDAVAKKIFRIDSGARAIAPFLAQWGLLKSFFQYRQERTRDIVAISRSDFTGISKTKVVDWLKGNLRSPEDVDRQLGALYRRLAGDIERRGDKRIANPTVSAARFLEDVKVTGVTAISNESAPGLQLLKAMDIELSEIGPKMTMEELGDLAAFRQQLRLASDMLRVPFSALKARVKESQIPSCIIQSALRRYGQDYPEWKGSELTDRHLACLALYAQITYVDKRTYENITRVRRKSPEISILLHRVEKAPNWQEIAGQLSSG
jgi:hypothetical protein